MARSKRRRKSFAGTPADHVREAARALIGVRAMRKEFQRNLKAGSCRRALENLVELGKREGAAREEKFWSRRSFNHPELKASSRRISKKARNGEVDAFYAACVKFKP